MSEDSIPQRLTRLKDRSGLSWPEIAKAAGYRGQSSIQRFYTDYKKPYLRLDIAERFVEAFAGKGKPPITRHEVLALAGVDGHNHLSSGGTERGLRYAGIVEAGTWRTVDSGGGRRL